MEEVESMGLRVLVVDDSPIDRTIVERLLKKSGESFEVITVDSGKKAMEVLGLDEGKARSPDASDLKIDIVLTDYCMPGMSGYDLLKAVKEHSCPKSIPVVIMSSENEPQRITRCRAIGAQDFILKPLQTNDVKRLKDYARPPVPTTQAGSKRKLPLDLTAETGSGSDQRRPRLAGVAVA
ncbi:two-component response regulator ORR1-like [Iris pallida]|uniref:Two-component response regulator ORR1-like n=1 Tax=Iris pallida TaxID=29817 RepID=A0AAX6I8Q5_IRIPA|nr:two-component response regulator ORR1-like [Iris pallida]